MESLHKLFYDNYCFFELLDFKLKIAIQVAQEIYIQTKVKGNTLCSSVRHLQVEEVPEGCVISIVYLRMYGEPVTQKYSTMCRACASQ